MRLNSILFFQKKKYRKKTDKLLKMNINFWRRLKFV